MITMTTQLRGNITKMAVIRGLRWFMLALPVLVLFCQENGLSLQDFLTIKAIFAVTILIAEIPSGYLADLTSRKFSIILANLASFLGSCVYAFSDSFWAFALAEVLIGLGVSLISGADSALIYDSLIELGETDRYKKVEGKLLFVSSGSEAVSAIIGGFLALISLRTPFYYRLAVMFLAIPVAFSLVEPPRRKLDTSSGKARVLFMIMKKCLFEELLLKWLIFYSVASATSTFVLVWFLQPYWKEIGLPLVWFGTAWALLNLSIGFFALTTAWFERKLGKEGTVLMLTILVPLSLAATAYLNNLWCFVPLLVLYFVRGVRTPLFKHYLNELTASEQRATVLSVQSLLVRVIFMIIGPLMGWIADTYSLSAAFYFCAACFGVMLVFCQLELLKHFSDH